MPTRSTKSTFPRPSTTTFHCRTTPLLRGASAPVRWPPSPPRRHQPRIPTCRPPRPSNGNALVIIQYENCSEKKHPEHITKNINNQVFPFYTFFRGICRKAAICSAGASVASLRRRNNSYFSSMENDRISWMSFTNPLCNKTVVIRL